MALSRRETSAWITGPGRALPALLRRLCRPSFRQQRRRLGGGKQRAVEGIKYAVLVVANIPMFLLYPFLQRYFVKGIMVGAIKG